MNINDFSGAKLAVLARDHVLTLLRDNTPGIAYPGLWDLPGGAREGTENATECALRETFEEASLRLVPEDISWRRIFANPNPGGPAHWFFVANPGWLTLPPVRLGDEGQAIRWMPVDAFLALENVVPHLPKRLQDYLAETRAAA